VAWNFDYIKLCIVRLGDLYRLRQWRTATICTRGRRVYQCEFSVAWSFCMFNLIIRVKSRLYALQSRQSLPQDKPVDEIVLAPSIARALILSGTFSFEPTLACAFIIATGSQILFYTIPSLDPVPTSMIAPMRNVVAFAVDEQHLRRPPPEFQERSEPIEFAIIKRNSIMLYSLRDRLFFQKVRFTMAPCIQWVTHAD
jgi:hypothetical protein